MNVITLLLTLIVKPSLNPLKSYGDKRIGQDVHNHRQYNSYPFIRASSWLIIITSTNALFVTFLSNMEINFKQSSSTGKMSSVDVSQLDKVNAISNKTTDNILMSDLCHEDQLYLNTLMDEDSSNLDDDEDKSVCSSTWSPMAHSPVITSKKMKKLRTPYAITLSLEDISYIRPSWGISKGIRTVEIKKKAKRVVEKEETVSDKNAIKESSYHCLLFLLTIALVFLTVPTYILDRKNEYDLILSNRAQVFPDTKIIEFYSLDEPTLIPRLRVLFGQGIPRNLKPERCTCEVYDSETRRYDSRSLGEPIGTCVSCLDWSVRSNLQVSVKQKEADGTVCYEVKWQSYDGLLTPLTDCFLLGEETWFGLGDLQTPSIPLNNLQRSGHFQLLSNLSTEFPKDSGPSGRLDSIPFGSHVNFSLFSNKGIHIGQLETDFQPYISLSTQSKTGEKRLCLSVACTDRCTSEWNRIDDIDKLRYENNVLKYSICSSSSLNSQVSRHIGLEMKRSVDDTGKSGSTEPAKNQSVLRKSESLIERETISNPSTVEVSSNLESRQVNSRIERDLPEGIGLIDRTIFATSSEFMSSLDGQTLRLYVDNIVKLGLKASSILLIDTRWETYVGSLKLSTVNFPKAKLLLEILHNKGFKIVFTVKPYIDSVVGVNNLNQLLESGRLYSSGYEQGFNSETKANIKRPSDIIKQQFLIRRKSLFKYLNESIHIPSDYVSKVPYLFKCRESQDGYCALLDLTKSENRAWFTSNIKRSSLLTQEADGILVGGAHPQSYEWNIHFRKGLSELIDNLYLNEKIFTLPQYTGNLGFIRLAPRRCDWLSLRSTIDSVLNLGLMGFPLVHPGSVWGDLSHIGANVTFDERQLNKMDSIYGEVHPSEKSDEDLMKRWLQVSVFLPILQFNNLGPIERYNLQELVQNLVKIRKMYIVPELKRNIPFTPLISYSKSNTNARLPLIRLVWSSQESNETLIPDQFTIGSDLLVAPILELGVRQRDIYLPGGFWRDELRQSIIRGGRWLHNYPVELNEIAWFTRANR